VSFDEEGDESVELIERVEDAEEVARVSMGCDGEEVA